MKKKLFYVILVFLVGTLTILATPFIFKMMLNNNFIFIQYEEMKEMLDEDKDYFLLISREGCSDCKALKEDLEKSKNKNYSFYVFEYEDGMSETLVPKLQDVYPEFDFVPYICYIKNGYIEKYNGEIELKQIFKWMDNK